MKKKLMAIGAIVAIVVGAGVAYAYFTDSGSGSGTAGVGGSTPIQLSSGPVSGLFPGGPSVPVTVTVHNPGSGNQYVDDVSGTVADNGACLGSWFVVQTIDFDTNLDPNESQQRTTNVVMNDSGTDQNECKGDTMTINWSSN